MAVDEVTTDQAGLAVSLEFVAALQRSPGALRRYSADLERRLERLARTTTSSRVPGPPPWMPGPSATRC
ncbi:MAG TPA: hypothetical protein VHY31_20040 [Streptosporangiaceae bacterium]|jgi:hypothetical protein|nr:hypothetical protein [Streptosporangiaceae bacterium]